jgi:hypothetical protein
MLSLTCELTIGNMKFPAVKSCYIDSSRSSVSDIMEVTIHKYRDFKMSSILEGDLVKFRAGYRQTGIYEEFAGVVREVTPGEESEFLIKCEDYFYYLRRPERTRSFKNIYAGDIVKQLCLEFPVDVSGVDKGIYIKRRVYVNKTVRYIINDLARLCGFDAFFRGERLIFGRKFAEADLHLPVRFAYGESIISENLSEDVEADYNKVIVISESTDGKGKVFRGVAGKGDRVKTVYMDGLSRDEVIKRATELYREYGYKGFKGDFTGFGYPSVYHSRKAFVSFPDITEKSGVYYIDRVEKNISDEGFRQKVYLGRIA